MIDRINALGQFLVNQTGKTFNFKSIKSDHMYPGILFSFAGEDYLVTPDKAELDLTIILIAVVNPSFAPSQKTSYTFTFFTKNAYPTITNIIIGIAKSDI